MDIDPLIIYALIGEISVMSHQPGYYRVELNSDGQIETYHDVDVNDRRLGNRRLLSVGAGSIPCNCDACLVGDDPAAWASDDIEALAAYEDQLREALAALAGSDERQPRESAAGPSLSGAVSALPSTGEIK